ncbi:MAG: hypothetical protein D6816_04840 [Bacteroidetes bacterium]|nr:MAG: hypothetical protein D6816_04840 [Bacteroidota bacterium]
MGKKSRDKGNRLERELVRLLCEAGLEAHRVPLSGAVSGYEQDVVLEIGGKEFRAEVKGRKEGTGFKLLERWLGEHGFLFVKRDRKPWLVVMSFERFLEILGRGVK